MEYKTVKQLRVSFSKAYASSKGHNKTAYGFALQLLSNVDDDITFNIRENQNGTAYNIGDLGEAIVKSILENKKEVSYSNAGISDIARLRMNEVKVFSNSNRYPNGFESPKGFISVSKHGIYYINKKTVAKNWDLMRDYKGLQKQPTLAWLDYIINNESPTLLKGLTNKMGL